MDIENIGIENACIIGSKNERIFGNRKGVICVAPMTHQRSWVMKFVHILGNHRMWKLCVFFFFLPDALAVVRPTGVACWISFVLAFSFIYC